MIIETFPAGILGCNCSVLGDEVSKEGIIVDPGGSVDKILSIVGKHQLKIKTILHTHAHYDHILGTKEVKEKTQGEICLHEADTFLYNNLNMQLQMMGADFLGETLPVDHFVSDGDQFKFGENTLKVFHTPGHTPGSICFYCDHKEKPTLLAGDTLFAGSIGRTDLWGGDFDAIIKSIKTKLLPLPDHTIVIPGHGNKTTIQKEKNFNPFIS
jgi:glyoxylase-like metal-dependent hydrolase (beta-lactamase superfamily II)